jgi:putative ABC transport system substrate-binding protein
VRLVENFARPLSLQPIFSPIHGMADIEQAVESLVQQPDGGIFFPTDLTITQLRGPITALVARRRVPAIYSDRVLVKSGGLISYDADRVEIYRRTASYVDRVLRGDNPGALPFQQPTKYHLTINLKAAKALGLTVPPTLLARADEVIE